jgi:hypothetical protein
LPINDKRQCLETDVKLFMEVRYWDEATQVLEEVKALRRKLESMRCNAPMEEVNVPL